MMRDPKIEPRPDDVLRKGSVERTSRGYDFHGDVEYREGIVIRSCSESAWRIWARDAEVVHVAQEDGTDASP